MANGLGHHIWNVPVPQIHRFGKVESPPHLGASLDQFIDEFLDYICTPKSQRTSPCVHQDLYPALLHAPLPIQEIQNVRLGQHGLHHLLGNLGLFRQPNRLYSNRILL